MFKNFLQKQDSLLSLNFEKIQNVNKERNLFRDTSEERSLSKNPRETVSGENISFDNFLGSSFSFGKGVSSPLRGRSPVMLQRESAFSPRSIEDTKNRYSKFSDFSKLCDISKLDHCPLWKQKISKFSAERINNSSSRSPTRERLVPSVSTFKPSAQKRSHEQAFEACFSGSEKSEESTHHQGHQGVKRKSKAQLKILKSEFEANPNWNNQDMLRIAKMCNLKRSQVYKWNWDQKKLSVLPSKVYVVQLPPNGSLSGDQKILLKETKALANLPKISLENFLTQNLGEQ